MQLRSLLLPVCLILISSASAQNSKENTPQVFNFVEQMPTAGYNLNSYLAANIIYPKKAERKGIQGRVIVKFIVTERGTVDSVHVVRGIGGGCDEEAVRVIENMPSWKPGKQNGKTVKVSFTLPIVFKLNGQPNQISYYDR